ncbi:hypothetical protein [Pokkaliibacter plantistimulans]|uniref:hypothetical protein n=2 Tax=Pokkaliibacter plantistimulans TaxID=1635171 RepID=UPI0014020F49
MMSNAEKRQSDAFQPLSKPVAKTKQKSSWLWFAGLYLGGVAVLTLVASTIKWGMHFL